MSWQRVLANHLGPEFWCPKAGQATWRHVLVPVSVLVRKGNRFFKKIITFPSCKVSC